MLVLGARVTGNRSYGVLLGTNGLEHQVVHTYFSDNGSVGTATAPDTTPPEFGGGVVVFSSQSVVAANLFESFLSAKRGIVDVPSVAGLSNIGNRVFYNRFRRIHTGSSVIYVHRCSGNGNEVQANALEDYDAATSIENWNPTTLLSGNSCNAEVCSIPVLTAPDCEGRHVP